jgi:hypothetical protein
LHAFQIFVLKSPGVLATAVCRNQYPCASASGPCPLASRAELMSGGVMLPPFVVAPLIQTSRATWAATCRDNSGLWRGFAGQHLSSSDGRPVILTSSGHDRLHKSLDLSFRESRAASCRCEESVLILCCAERKQSFECWDLLCHRNLGIRYQESDKFFLIPDPCVSASCARGGAAESMLLARAVGSLCARG